MQENWRNNREKKWIIIVLAIMFALVALLVVMAGRLISRHTGEWKVSFGKSRREESVTETPVVTQTAKEKYPGIEWYLEERMETVKHKKALEEVLGTAYDGIWTVTEDSMSCIAEKNGKWGMVSVTGEVLVPIRFDRFSFMDNTGWVEFEKDGLFCVYDGNGTLIREYLNKTEFRMESEEAYLYRTTKAYMSGMEITVIVPENSRNDYYGVEYRNKETGELLYRAVGGYEEVGVFSYPDNTGRAVAIRKTEDVNMIYYITKDGCESRVMELPEGVNGRWFAFMGDYSWADYALSGGWVKVFVSDAVPDFLIDRYEEYYAFLNVDSMELLPFPEKYQEYFSLYSSGRGNAAAFCTTGGEDTRKYAVCTGSKVLTEELYYWVEFEENYILGGSDNGVDILDYSGNKLQNYPQVSGEFVNGRMLVRDENGIYFIDEKLEKCSEYLLEDQEIDRLFSRGVVYQEQYYFLKEFAMEEISQKTVEAQPVPTTIPVPTDVPVKLSDETYRVVEVGFEVCSYLGNMYLIWKDSGYGLVDLDGNTVVKPEYESWVCGDDGSVALVDYEGTTHVFDCNGKKMYSYICDQGTMTNAVGQQFDRAVFYREGMRIEFDYNYDDAYYGVHYYNAATGELIFELTDEMCLWAENPKPDFQTASLPDNTGTAVVIAGDGVENLIYKITKDGYTEEIHEEKYVERRLFHPSDHIVWDFAYLSDGWLMTTVCEERGELLSYSREWYQMLFNIHTKERIELPKQYQDWYGECYVNSKGLYYGISGESRFDFENGEADCIYYAICCGDIRLTEELYEWIDFGEKHIIAGNKSFSHILSYEGEVLAEYKDIAFPFVDGKTLVVDTQGQAFYIDEELCRCSEVIQSNVDFCHTNYVRKGRRNILIKGKTKEE